ncbi:MAG: hypothetical protein ABI423_04110 [Burkholderiales bacterium]
MFRRLLGVAVLAAALPPAQAQESPRAAGGNAFNPGISLILQGTAASSSRDPASYRIDGFAPTGGEVGPAPRGFSLGESEIGIAANIDPNFSGQLVASFSADNKVEVEEAFFQTLALGGGFTVKGGRFLSGIGYLNGIHQHAWDFQDAPLAYKAFLGGRLNDDGLQLRWLAPTDLFLEFGAELGSGRVFPATPNSRNGANAATLFAHLGGDLGVSTAWRTGVSLLRARPEGRAFDDVDGLGNPVTQSFTGASTLLIADFVLKWSPNGNATSTNFKLQGEFFRRKESGALSYDDGTALTGDYASRQSGWYLQGVYQFMPRWRAGLRYDRLDRGTVDAAVPLAGPLASDYNPSRVTVMLDWSGSEFSRIRLQLAQDKSRAGLTDNQVLLQYLFSLGAHGAHTF